MSLDTDHQQMSPAARARTVVSTATEVRVGVLQDADTVQRHAVADDGSVLFVPAATSRLGRLPASLPSSPLLTLTAFDVAPVPVADRVRAVVTLQGTVARDPDADGSVLRLQPAQVVLRTHGALPPASAQAPAQAQAPALVDVADYLAARTDPVAPVEARWLTHLHDDHQDAMAALARWRRPWLGDDTRVLPLALDSGGLVLRLQHQDGTDEDLRLPFATPATCACEASEAFNGLLARACPGSADAAACGG